MRRAARSRPRGRSGRRSARTGWRPRSAPTTPLCRSPSRTVSLCREHVPERERDAHGVLQELEAAHPGPEPLARRRRTRRPATRSNSPARRRGTISSGSPSARLSSTSGCEARKVAIATGISVAPAVGKEAMRKPAPAHPGDRRDARPRPPRGCARIPSVCSTSAAPAAVGRTPAIALDQRDARLGLELGDRLRDRRLRVGERVRGGREGAAGRDLAEHLQALHVQH